MNIHKGDTVQILQGKDRSKKGKVLKVFPKDQKIVVEGANIMVRHTRPKKQGQKGEKVNIPAPMTVSRAMLVCPKCSKPTRVGRKLEGDKKLRQCKKCSATFE